jgi:hypothetical protein
LSADGQSRDGSPGVSAGALVAEDIASRCRRVLWAQDRAASAEVSVEASEAASKEAAAVVDLEEGVDSAAAFEEATILDPGAAAETARTASEHPAMRHPGPDSVVATEDSKAEIAISPGVGMNRVVAVAHLKTDMVAAVAAVASATVMPGVPAATWNRSDLERMVGIVEAIAAVIAAVIAAATETTTVRPEMTTTVSAATRADTKTPGNCDDTSKTWTCLVVGLYLFSSLIVSFTCFPFSTEGKRGCPLLGSSWQKSLSYQQGDRSFLLVYVHIFLYAAINLDKTR